jgi:hypothetical protein
VPWLVRLDFGTNSLGDCPDIEETGICDPKVFCPVELGNGSFPVSFAILHQGQ